MTESKPSPDPTELEELAQLRARIQELETLVRSRDANVQALVENLDVGVMSIDNTTQRITWANPACARILGYSSAREVIGASVFDHYVDPQERPQILARLMADPDFRTRGVARFEVKRRRKDTQEVITVLLTISVTFDEKHYPLKLDCVIEDVSERHRAEESRLRLEKLESLAVLAGGIAHDFNNILTAVLGNVTLASRHLSDPKLAAERLSLAEKAVGRARDLTQQLITFARGGAPNKTKGSVAEVVSESASFCLRGSNVLCSFDEAPDLWSAEFDAGQISQVFNNLFINAKQAMPHGGAIRVSLDNLTVALTDELPLQPGRYLRVQVSDEGGGIPSEYLERIFDPYFSTKPTGTGLGLATALSIIRRHDGQITVHTRPGEGSTFTIYLPAASGELAPLAQGPQVPLPKVQGRPRLLVMDDEPMVLNVARALLQHGGYEVDTAADGKKAVSLYEKALRAGRPYAAIILDLTVPGGHGGAEALLRIQKIDPNVKAIASSGYSQDPIMADYQEHGFAGVLAKPYLASDMYAILSQVLGG